MDTCDECKRILPEEHYSDDAGSWCYDCARELRRQAAIDAGIPQSVIAGDTKLTDCFTREYIDSQRDPQNAQMLREAAGDNE